LRSLDIHDVVTLLDGRPELVGEIQDATPALRTYVKGELAKLQAERDFDYAVEGAMASYGPVGIDRANLVRERLDRLVSM
jgi:hypothetical protein